MKKTLLGLCALTLLSACQTTTTSSHLQDGEVYGTDIGTILSREAGLSMSAANEAKMNSEIEKALFFSENGLTTSWYASSSARIRPEGEVRDRRDRQCRRFRHGVMKENNWVNGSAIACREHNVAWYLIENRWDRNPNRRAGDTEKPWRRDSTQPSKGKWENLSGELGGNSSRKW